MDPHLKQLLTPNPNIHHKSKLIGIGSNILNGMSRKKSEMNIIEDKYLSGANFEINPYMDSGFDRTLMLQ